MPDRLRYIRIAIATALMARGIRPPMGGEVWNTGQVRRVLAHATEQDVANAA